LQQLFSSLKPECRLILLQFSKAQKRRLKINAQFEAEKMIHRVKVKQGKIKYCTQTRQTFRGQFLLRTNMLYNLHTTCVKSLFVSYPCLLPITRSNFAKSYKGFQVALRLCGARKNVAIDRRAKEESKRHRK
jgi:hypothetical protein